jgi:hypothetical protein
VRPDDHPGEEIAEDDRLAQSLKDDRSYGGHAQNYREILEERVGIHPAEFTRAYAGKNKRPPLLVAFFF